MPLAGLGRFAVYEMPRGLLKNSVIPPKMML
jgi:hypothetical protein